MIILLVCQKNKSAYRIVFACMVILWFMNMYKFVRMCEILK